jgi:hypothetical protein
MLSAQRFSGSYLTYLVAALLKHGTVTIPVLQRP